MIEEASYILESISNNPGVTTTQFLAALDLNGIIIPTERSVLLEAATTIELSLDSVEDTNTYQVTIDYSTTNSNHLQINEKVTQGLTFNNDDPPVALTSVFGEVQTIDKISPIAGRIQVSQIGVSGVEEARDFIASSTLTLTGAESLKTVTITKVYDIGDNSAFVDPTDSQAQNVDFEVSADGILDFTESNPFGDPSDNY